jgi:hypothetical protein
MGKIQVRSRDQQLKINLKWLSLASGKKLSPFLLGCVVNIQWCLNYYSQTKTRNTKNMLNSHTIIAKRSKNIFQQADSIILPETPQIPALSGAHLRDGWNLIFQWLILRWKTFMTLSQVVKNSKKSEIFLWVPPDA